VEPKPRLELLVQVQAVVPDLPRRDEPQQLVVVQQERPRLLLGGCYQVASLDAVPRMTSSNSRVPDISTYRSSIPLISFGFVPLGLGLTSASPPPAHSRSPSLLASHAPDSCSPVGATSLPVA